MSQEQLVSSRNKFKTMTVICSHLNENFLANGHHYRLGLMYIASLSLSDGKGGWSGTEVSTCDHSHMEMLGLVT